MTEFVLLVNTLNLVLQLFLTFFLLTESIESVYDKRLSIIARIELLRRWGFAMSAGNFTEGKYQADDGKVWRIKCQPETTALTLNSVQNDFPATALTVGLPRLKISTSRRKQGVRPRYVSVELTANGTGKTEEYKAGTRHDIVVFDPDVFVNYSLGETGTYQGIACKLMFKSGECSS